MPKRTPTAAQVSAWLRSDIELPNLAVRTGEALDFAGRAFAPLAAAGFLSVVFGTAQLTDGDLLEAGAVILEIDAARFVALTILAAAFIVVPAMVFLLAISLGRSVGVESVLRRPVSRVITVAVAIGSAVGGLVTGVGGLVGFCLTILATAIAGFAATTPIDGRSTVNDGLPVIVAWLVCAIAWVTATMAWSSLLPRETLVVACATRSDRDLGASSALGLSGSGSAKSMSASTERDKNCSKSVGGTVVLDEGGDWFTFWDGSTVVHVAPERVVSRN